MIRRARAARTPAEVTPVRWGKQEAQVTSGVASSMAFEGGSIGIRPVVSVRRFISPKMPPGSPRLQASGGTAAC